jgi:hypothetical protein
VVNGVAKKQPTDDRAPSSERAYAADWRDFCAFVARLGRARLPAEAETVALYVADLKRRGRRPATIARKLAAIAVYHSSMDHPTPTAHDVVRAVVRGTRRQLGVAQPQKTALALDALRSLILKYPEYPEYPGGSSLANRHGLPMRLRKRQQSARSSRSAGRA